MSDPLQTDTQPPIPSAPTPTPPPPLLTPTDAIVPTTADPPPPYPTPNRHRRSRRQARLVHGQSTDSDYDSSPQLSRHIHPLPSYVSGATDTDVNENTPLLLAPPSPRSLVGHNHRLSAAAAPGGGGSRGRPRSLSHTSVVSYASAAPSLAQTVISLFQDYDDNEGDDTDMDYDILSDTDRAVGLGLNGHCDHLRDDQGQDAAAAAQRRQWTLFSRRAWRRYFRPLTRRVYYLALFHLLVLNFPYALAAWIYLFVFTLTGTTLMIALPLGTVLCFFDLLGARAFARGELALQSTFHGPLAYPAPYPPRPIFTRLREPTASQIEAGLDTTTYETSFYKNAYSMFTDSTSYQALFYFLVIKPSITLIFSISLVVLFPVCFCLILPAPAFLRAMRKLGIWQANVAIEGLYLAVS